MTASDIVDPDEPETSVRSVTLASYPKIKTFESIASVRESAPSPECEVLNVRWKQADGRPDCSRHRIDGKAGDSAHFAIVSDALVEILARHRLQAAGFFQDESVPLHQARQGRGGKIADVGRGQPLLPHAGQGGGDAGARGGAGEAEDRTVRH